MKEESNKRSNLAIWKINRNYYLLDSLSADETILKIISIHNKKDDVKKYLYKEFKEIILINSEIENKKIKIFHRTRKSSGWENFIGHIVNSEKLDKNIFFNMDNDFLCFIYDETDVFLITAGAGYHAIQEFIDDSFPMEVAKKVFAGGFNYAEIRDLTGVAYSKSENFRRSYNFSRQEAFGKVWKKLSGRIDPEVIKDNSELSLVIDSKKKINADMKSSFTFRKSVIFEEIIQLIIAIQNLPELTEERKEIFKFLDTLKEIKGKNPNKVLKTKLLKTIFLILTEETFQKANDFDLCHPSEIFNFFSGNSFTINNQVISSAYHPSAEDVLKFIKNKKLVNLNNFNDFRKSFENLQFSFQKNENDKYPISTNLLRYFHGEIVNNKKTYFLIDNKWYEPLGTFLDVLLDDFVTEVFNKDEGIIINDIPFLIWGKESEGDFNIRQSNENNFYAGDRIFVITRKGKIELFDLLYVVDNKLFIIQVKNNFGASVRDACSQIQMAAEIIEEDVKKECKNLKKYYQEWKSNKNNNLSESDFLKLFSDKNRIYVLACSTKQNFTKEDFENKRLYSNIAQFEVLGIKHAFEIKRYDFKIQHISKS